MILYKTSRGDVVRVDGNAIDGQTLRKYTTTITGNGVDTVFVIEHSLDTQDILFRMNDTDGLVLIDYTIIDNNNIHITFPNPPSLEDSYNVTIYDICGYINGTMPNPTPSDIDLSNYLAKNNSSPYSPEEDYNPATKKYVDDSIFDAVGDLGELLDAINRTVI